MLILVGLCIRLSLAGKYAEYKFGLSYGSKYIDYSGRNFHADNGGSSGTSHPTHSDRGVFIGGGDKHVLLPESYSSTKLSSSFSILMWAMPKSQSGRLFYRGLGYVNNIAIVGQSANFSLNYQRNISASGVSGVFDNYLPQNSFETGKWVLILLVNTNSNFVFYTNTHQVSAAFYNYKEQTDLYLTCIGSYDNKRPAFHGFVWYFLINDAVTMVPSDYYSDGTFETCTFGPCITCTTAFKDPTYGNLCLATVTDETKNSNSQTCTNSNGCSIYTNYQCSCSNSCGYDITKGTCTCISSTGASTSTSCSCTSSYTLRSSKCCNPKCGTCTTSENCLTCIDPNASVTSGKCYCKAGYYGTPSTTSTTACSLCKSKCSSCTSSTDCSSCFDPNAEVSANACVCKSGFYGSASVSTTTTCSACSTGCSSCTSSTDCFACHDPNAEVSGGACVCKSGYLGTPSSTSTTSCFICKVGCSACSSDNGCTACYDATATAVSNNCVCKAGYSGTPSLDSTAGCFMCLDKCKTCSSGSDCLSCLDPNAVVSGTTCVCKTGYYGTASSTTTSTCSECNQGCSSCTSNSDCASCDDPNAEPSGTACVCKSGMNGTPSRTSTTGCFICKAKCSNCILTGGCTACFDPNAHVISDSCVCKSGYYGTASSDSTTSCFACPAECSSCTSSTQCLLCKDPNGQPVSGTCQCKSGYYGTPSTSLISSCSSCGSGCSTCIDSTTCSLCFDPNAIVSAADCICKSAHHGTPSSSFNLPGCLACGAGCTSCSSSDSCDSCADANSEFVSTACFCKSGYYGTITSLSSVCALCPSTCSSCNSNIDCTSCFDPLAAIISGACMCAEGFYGSPSTGPSSTCLQCASKCKSCTDGSSCTTCLDPNAEVISGECKCKSDFKGTPSLTTTSTCYQCPGGCSDCMGMSCTACNDPNAEAVSGSCKCKNGFYGTASLTSTTGCKTCPQGCLTCTSASKCLACTEQKMGLVEDLCKCENGYYMKAGTCLKCSSECLTCLNEFRCLTCVTSNSKANSKGECECEAGYFNETVLLTKNDCLPCMDECSSCSNNSTCLTCTANNAQINSLGRCECQEKYWNDSLLFYEDSCKECYFRCGACKEASTCLSCIGENAELDSSGSCVCKTGFYYQNDDDLDCKACPGYKIEGKCKAICGQNEIFINDYCVSCPDMCETCLKNLTCTSCNENAFLQDGLCQCSPGYKSIDLSCVQSFFFFTLVDLGFHSIQLTFNEQPADVLEKKDFEVLFNNKSQDFSFVNKDNLTFIITPKASGNDSIPSSVNITVKKYPLYSKENSELNMYSINFAYAMQKNTFSAIESMAQGAVSSSVSSSAVVSNPAASWVLVNTIHMIIYMPLNSIPYTQRIKDFARSIGSFNMIPNFIEMIFSGNSTKIPYFEARDFGFSTSLFWINFGKNLIILIFFVSGIPILFGLSKISKIKGFCLKILSNYRFTFFLRFWIQVYLEIGIFALIQLTSTVRIEDQGYFNYASAGVAFVTSNQILVGVTPLILIFLICKYHSYFTVPEISKKYGSFFAEFRNDQGVMGYMFYPIYFIRRLEFMLVQIYLNDYPGLQISLNILFSVIQLMYLSYYRPFKEPLILFSEFMGEICVINAFIASIFFLDDKNLFDVQDVEDVIIYSVLIAMCAQMMICIYYTFKSLLKLWKKLRQSKELSFSTKIGKESDSALIAVKSSTMNNKMMEEN